MNDFYQPIKEWEYFDFPIEISNISTLNGLCNFGPACSIVIWRNDDFKLKAKISGYLPSPLKLENQTEPGPGNFALAETITGYRTDNLFRFTLHECIVTNSTQSGVVYPNLGMHFEAELSLDHFITEFMFGDELLEPTSHFDWYLGNQFDVSFSRRTDRKLQKIYTRTRVSKEEDNDLLNLESSGSGWDFFEINITGVKCIVSLVPQTFGPKWARCLAIEYRKTDGFVHDENIKTAIKNLVGFLLGSELFLIGSTILTGHSILEQKAFSPLISGTQAYCSKAGSPPIKFNRQHKSGDIEGLTNSLLPNYLKLMDELELNDIMWRYFEAAELAIGINLPILSSAIESLANRFIRKMNITDYYLPSKEYLKLIDPELQILKKKLILIPEAQKILSKIQNACNRGPNEKLELFFEFLGLHLSPVERDAIRARNSMVHGGSTYKTKEEVKPLIIKTRVYETLFHRTFLKVLKYEGYYIDYALEKRPSKKIT